MADILISKFTTQIPRAGATPATPGFAESEGQDPVAPSGTPQVYTPVTIGSPANGLSISGTQVLTIGLASTSATGALSSTDWNTFNGKLNLTSPITGYTVGANTALTNTDTILQAFGKVQGQINARISGTIASGQVAFGTGVNTVGGDSGMRYANTSGNSTLTIQGTGTGQASFLTVSNNGLVSLNLLSNNSSNFFISSTSLVFRARSSGIIEFQTTDSNTLRWFITNGGNLTAANGNTINTTNNGNLIIAPNGTGLVMIGSGTPTNLLDVNGTARIRTISNLGSAATSVLVPSATGVVSLRTLAELSADGLGSKWTDVTGGIFRNGAVAVGRTTIPTSSSFSVQSLSATGTVKFFNLFDNSGAEILYVRQDGLLGSNGQRSIFGNPTTNISTTGHNFAASTGLNGNSSPIVRVLGIGDAIVSDFNTNVVKIYVSRLEVGNPTSPTTLGTTFKGASNTTGVVFRIDNSSNVALISVQGNGDITFAEGSDFILGTTTGTRIGTATNQRLAFYNSTPIVQPSGDILTALSNLGLIASPTITQVDQFAVKTTASADQTLPSGTLTILDYDTTLLNNSTATYTVGTTGRITINTTGIYTITAGVVIEADAVTALESAFLGIFRNGNLVAISSINTTIAAGAQSGLSTSTILSLTATDIIDCRALVNSVGGVANGLARRLGTLLGANATQVNSLSITKNSM